jgi:hypothetical protein
LNSKLLVGFLDPFHGLIKVYPRVLRSVSTFFIKGAIKY